MDIVTFLEQTMLGQAAPNPRWQYSWTPLPIIEANPTPVPETSFFDPGAVVAAVSAMNQVKPNPIWHFDSPVFAGAGVQVSNVSCKVRSMDYMKMPVLNQIEWGPVTLSYNGSEIALPLTTQFLSRSRYVKDGTINGGSAGAYWQLPANVDQSFEMVFEYLIPFGGVPAPCLHIGNDDPFSDNCFSVSHTDPGSQAVSTVRITPLHLIVVVSLVCCKERNDWVPDVTGIDNPLGVGRLYPLLMIATGDLITSVTGSVKLTRPSQTAHAHIMDEAMTPEIGSAFFADQNNRSFINRKAPIPTWNTIFDYYYIDPAPGKYTLVTPSDWGTEQTIPDAVLELERFPRDVTKVRGQGEFDNLHIAPKMIASQDILTDDHNKDLTGLNRITMAPFCIHDCLHLHVRWGNDYNDIQVKGWRGQTPFAVAGAPLVPGNQEVTLELLSPVSYRYTANAYGPAIGQWQIIMHHGTAYALSYIPNALGPLRYITMDTLDESITSASWAAFYWKLRYGRLPPPYGQQVEYLTCKPEKFSILAPNAAKAQHAMHGASGSY